MREACKMYLAVTLCFGLIMGQFARPVRASSSGAVAQSNASFIPNSVGTAATSHRNQSRTAYSSNEIAPPHRGNLRSNGARTLRLRAQANGQSQSENLSGQSSTVLPDGRVLLLGGESKDGPASSVFIKDSASEQMTQLPIHLLHARAYHTATLLPDGSVFVFGGLTKGNDIEKASEIFDPSSLRFQELSIIGLTLRSSHSATLLTDGRVMMAGGDSEDGEVAGKIEFWDPRNQIVSSSSIEMLVPRRAHQATLRPDGSVLFWGGFDKYGDPLTYGEVFDPSTQTAWMESSRAQDDRRPPVVEASIPQDGDQSVALDVVISVRFSKPLHVQRLNANTVTLSGPNIDPVVAKVVPAEAGMLVFVTPQSALLPGSGYSLLISGATDSAGQSLPSTTITFTTAGQSASGQTGIISSGNQNTSDALDSNSRKAPALQAPAGTTALAGQTLQLNGRPLSNVTLTIDQQVSQTDKTGRFLLTGLAPGHHVMLIDGRSASRPRKSYGVFEVGVDLVANITNVLGYTIWMTALDVAHTVTIASPTLTEAVVTTPLLPGLELHIPPGTVIRDHDGQVVTQISITQVPLDRPPFPLPSGVQVPIYFTIQPGAAYLETWGHGGARLIYPNTMGYLPGSKIQFWNYDADAKGWHVYGHGTVQPDKRSIIPDPTVEIYEFTGAMVGNLGNRPAAPPTPGGEKGGEPIDLSTGLFTMTKTDLYLPDVIPLSLTRGYLAGDTITRNFGIGSNDSFDIFIAGTQFPYTYIDLILADGTTIYYPRISSGTGYADAVYEHTSTPTMYYGSTITYNGNNKTWNLIFKDGTKYIFPDSSGSNSPNVAAITSLSDRLGNTVTYVRDGLANLTKVISPNGRWISFTRDSNSRITQAQDNTGRTVNYTYDSGGRLATVTDANGGVTTYTYDTSNRMLTIKDARWIVYLTNQYDTSGRVTQQTQADNSTYHFSYTSSGGVITQTDMTDPRGSVRRLTFNSAGYALTDTVALGAPEQQTISYTLIPGSNLQSLVTDALNRQTAYSYDTLGNITSITWLAGTPNAVTGSFSYDSNFGLLTSVTDPLNRTISFAYDLSGNLLSVTDPLQHQTTSTYNAAGQPITTTDDTGHTFQFAYDSGDLVSVTDPLGNTSSRFLDSGGRVLFSADASGHLTDYQYNQMNQVTSLTDPQGNITSLAYDSNGNLVSVTDANSHQTQYTYDNMDRLATRKDALQNQQSYQYDANGNITQIIDRRGKVTTYNYDALNRLVFVGYGTQAGPTYESTVNYTYDAGDRLTQAVDSLAGAITRAYDGLDRLTSETTSQGTVSYTYDAASRRQTMTVAGQTQIGYAFDAANRLTQIAQGTATVGFTYDNANRKATVTFPNGIVSSYSYNSASQLTGITYTNGTTTVGNLTYGYDLSARRTSVGGSLAGVNLPNPVAQAAYNGNNQMTAWGTANLFYDLNGNMTSNGTDAYTWDDRNHLVSTLSGASFQYDAFGRRTSKTSGGTTTTILYDGSNVVQEVIGSTNIANSLGGRQIDELFQRADSAGARSFLTDALGSPFALSDSTGALQTQYTYEPFGNATASGPATTNSFTYTGRELDPTGLYFYRDRYYNAQLGRFISEDPVGFSGGINIYAYVRNNPLSFVDPLGHDSCKQTYNSVLKYTDQYFDLAKKSPITPPENAYDYWEYYETMDKMGKVKKSAGKLAKALGDDVKGLIGGGSCGGANF